MLANYLFWRIADFSKFYIADSLKQPGLRFYEKVYGLMRLQQGWQRCVGQGKTYFSTALAAVMARKEPIDNVQFIIDAVRGEALKLISRFTAVNDDDKNALLKEVSAIEVLANYPSEYFDDSALEKLYQSASVIKGNYFETVLKLEHFRSTTYGQRISKTVKETRWSSYLDESFDKSIYSNSKSFIFMHPTDLQYPHYHAYLPDYINFARLGSKIASQYGIAINYIVSQFLLRVHFA